MKVEIKEILDKLEKCYLEYNKLYEKYHEDDMRFIIHLDEAKAILDYITNLQEEVRVNNDLIPYFKNKEKKLKKEITNLQQENERLKEIEKEHKNCTRKHWQQKCGEHHAKELFYRLTIEKTIEYIKQHSNNLVECLYVEEVKDLLNILKGE